MKRFSGKRGKCPAREALSSHVDGELDPAQAEALAKHLAGCDECARTVGELAWLKSHVSSLAAVL
jgi:anti-sigma factor RsiW